MLHNTGYNKCVTDRQAGSVIDVASGTFKMRFTGRPSRPRTRGRSIVATFRRNGFLNFVYFTDYENRDPEAIANSAIARTAQTNCADKYRAARAGKGCSEIQFPTGDEINGPAAHQRRERPGCAARRLRPRSRRRPADRPDRGLRRRARLRPQQRQLQRRRRDVSRRGKITPNAKTMAMPPSNQQLADVADERRHRLLGQDDHPPQDGRRWTSPTTTPPAPRPPRPTSRGRSTACSTSNNGACTGEYPTDANYNESAACGNVYVSGTYCQVADDRRRQRHDRAPDDRRAARQRSTDANITASRRHRRDARADRQQLRARRLTVSPRPEGNCNGNLDSTQRPTSTTSASRPRSSRSSTPSSWTTTTAAGSAR